MEVSLNQASITAIQVLNTALVEHGGRLCLRPRVVQLGL